MNKRVGLFLLLALTLAVVAVAGTAHVQARGATVPFKVKCTTYPQVDATGFPLLEVTIPGDCIGTHLGNSRFYSKLSGYILGDPPWVQEGKMEFTAANGATLSGYYEGHFVPNDIGGNDWRGDYWIDGGTGRFDGYTGSGIYYGGGDGSSATLTFEGTLTKP